jgi:hypothetical protein
MAFRPGEALLPTTDCRLLPSDCTSAEKNERRRKKEEPTRPSPACHLSPPSSNYPLPFFSGGRHGEDSRLPPDCPTAGPSDRTRPNRPQPRNDAPREAPAIDTHTFPKILTFIQRYSANSIEHLWRRGRSGGHLPLAKMACGPGLPQYSHRTRGDFPLRAGSR